MKSDYRPDPAFLDLGEGFADPVESAPFNTKVIRFRNDRAAAEIGLATLDDKAWQNHFADFLPLTDNIPRPLAQRYHGHQFRHYNPMIGDGRGFLFAQLRDDRGRLMDLGTKGSGVTPYSRSGDGRLTLKGAVREVLASEMLEALGTYTSRTFSVIETGEELFRGDEPSPTRSAVLVRLTHGNIRIGTFQRHAYHRDNDRLIKLVDYCLTNYFNQNLNGTPEDRVLQFLDLVCTTTANQAADLMASGFVHGVLNSDNINITGEIFDFGPWRFLPKLDYNFTAAYFDEIGLYAYGRQAEAIQWDLFQLAGALLSFTDEAKARAALAPFASRLESALRTRFIKKLGIKPTEADSDDALLKMINSFLARTDIPFEQFFFDWYGGGISEIRANNSPYKQHYGAPDNSDLISALKSRDPAKRETLDNRYFKEDQPIMMLIDEVEDIWSAIADRDDWKPFNDKIDQVRLMGTVLSQSI